MLTAEQIDDAAHRLHSAEQAHEQMRALTLSWPDMDMDDAYAIQARWMEIKRAEGA